MFVILESRPSGESSPHQRSPRLLIPTQLGTTHHYAPVLIEETLDFTPIQFVHLLVSTIVPYFFANASP